MHSIKKVELKEYLIKDINPIYNDNSYKDNLIFKLL